MTIKALGQNDSGKVASGIYLHGKLEDINGYDLVEFEPPKERGLYECFVDIQGKIYEARLFYWQVELSIDYKMDRGLIVSIDDNDALVFASEKYLRSASWI